MKKINDILKYDFKDFNLLKVALTHSSYSADTGEDNYERLEYLGDSILGQIVAEYLYNNFELSAGDLSKDRAKLVNEHVLSDLVVKLGISEYVRTGKSIKNVSHSIYADVYESLLAAIYLDGGDYKKFVYDTLIVSKQNVEKIIENNTDYKTILQELLAKTHKSYNYNVVSTSGVGTDTLFEVELIIDNVKVSKCQAKSIKNAEQQCAKYAYEKLTKMPN